MTYRIGWTCVNVKVIHLLQPFRAFVQQLTLFQLTARRAVPLRRLSFLSCTYLAHVYVNNMQDNARRRRRALSYVALRCVASRFGVNAAMRNNSVENCVAYSQWF